MNTGLANLGVRFANSSIISFVINGVFSTWWAREDSNLQPNRYERLALTIELRARCFAAEMPAIGTAKLGVPHTVLHRERQSHARCPLSNIGAVFLACLRTRRRLAAIP